ncbi:MAG: tripartite tricarboxylate transporter TctB family protein [Rhodospirillales bacterium]
MSEARLGRRLDVRDVVAGGVLVVVGLSAALYATENYATGALRRMGPGMFPMMLGYLLAALGALILAPALFRGGAMPAPDWRPLVAILLGISAFAVIVERYGMVPAIVGLTACVVFADGRPRVLRSLVLAGVLSAIAFVVFQLALDIPLPAYRWPS